MAKVRLAKKNAQNKTGIVPVISVFLEEILMVLVIGVIILVEPHFAYLPIEQRLE